MIPKLGRDVGVNTTANLIANLITVAAVYLVGVAAGLLPYSGFIASGAFFILFTSGIFGLVVAREIKTSLARVRLRLICSYLLALALPLMFIITSVERSRDSVAGWLAAMIVVLFLIASAASLWLLRYYRRAYAKQQAVASRTERIAEYRNRPNRRFASREPRIIRRQRLPQRGRTPS